MTFTRASATRLTAKARRCLKSRVDWASAATTFRQRRAFAVSLVARSEEHTSELQSLRHLVCRLLLEKKKNLTSRQAFWLADRMPQSMPRDISLKKEIILATTNPKY